MKNILVTDCGGTGENVLVYTPDNISAEMYGKALNIRGFSFCDCFEISDNELQYFCIDDRFTLSADLVAVVERLNT